MIRTEQRRVAVDGPQAGMIASCIRSNKTRALTLSSLALLLTACGAPPTDVAQMSETITAKLTEAVDLDVAAAPEAINLEAGFSEAVRAAVQGNEGYRAAIALEASAMGQIGVASSVRRPQVNGNANLGGTRETGGNTPDETTTGVAGGLNISQLIYDGGDSTAAVNQATAEALAARAERETRGNDLALQAARAWIDVWQFAERLGLLRARTIEMDTMIAQMERMAANGFVDRAALDSARRQIVDITLEETRLAADLLEARVRFLRFYNRTPEHLRQPAELITVSQAGAAAATWQQAPGLKRNAAELLIADSAVASAEAAFRPRARLQAGVSSPMQDGESTDTSVGLVLQYTFSDGGRRRSQLEVAQARAMAVEAQLVDAQRTLKAELDAALTRLAAIERSMPLVAEQIRLSASEAETSQSQITTGQSTLRQLVEAEIENYRAQDRQIAMQAERQILLLTIAGRTGELGRLIGLQTDRPGDARVALSPAGQD
ncbi:TolC family protein [Yoonia sp.]|nr:TolC family protein [Yoonia sp.]